MYALRHGLWRMRLELVLQDAWVGCYWTWKLALYETPYGLVTTELHIYICLVPCVPLHVVLGRIAAQERVG